MQPKLKNELEQKIGIAEEAKLDVWQNETLTKAGISVSVLREDAIHPWIQGNKWYKLRPWLLEAINGTYSGVASMGGPYSNHLIALAHACWTLKIKFHAYIRGEESEWTANPVTQKLKDWNAIVKPLTRTEFRKLHQTKFQRPPLFDHNTDLLWVPMGGSDPVSIRSVADWAHKIENRFPDFTHVVLPVGSGGTVAGFCSGLSESKSVLAISCLKVGIDYLENEFENLVQNEPFRKPNWILDYHFGGFGKATPELNAFCDSFFGTNGFQIEPVYSGKTFFAVSDLAQKGHFPSGSKVLLVHTGGIFTWNIS